MSSPFSSRGGRAFRKNHDPTKAKANWVYSDEDIRQLYGVSRNTPNNWVKAGLQPVPGTSPRLFMGSELNRFHAEQRAQAKRPQVGANLFCICCRSSHSMEGKNVTLSSLCGFSGKLAWTCPVCQQKFVRTVGPLILERLVRHGVVILRTTEAIE
jgi:transposase-like protein